MGDADGENVAADQKTRVFLSYSRKDRAFAENLRDRLIRDDFDAFLDIHDIVKGEPWQERLQSLIFGADAVLFLLSPDSVSSEVCDWEVNEAERLGKRVMPVVCRAVAEDAVPGRLKRLNYTFLDAPEKWAGEYSALCRELKRDIAWVREHTRISERAAAWDRSGRPQREKLLAADELRDARHWQNQRPTNLALSEVCIAFLDASEQKNEQDRERLLTITGRAFVPPAQQALAEQRFDACLRFTAAGTILGEDCDMRLVPERIATAQQAAEQMRLRAILASGAEYSDTEYYDWGPTRAGLARTEESEGSDAWDNAWDDAWYDPNGTGGFAVSLDDKLVRVFDTKTRREIAKLSGHDGSISSIEIGGDGQHILTLSEDGSARLWKVATWKLCKLMRMEEDIVAAAFDPTGTLIATASFTLVSLWPVDGEQRVVLETVHDREQIDGVRFSRRGGYLIVYHENPEYRHHCRILDIQHEKSWTDELDDLDQVDWSSFDPEDAYLAIPWGKGVKIVALGGSLDGATVLRCDEDIRSASYSPDGRYVLGHGAHNTFVWDAARSQTICTWDTDTMRQDGAQIVTEKANEPIQIWSVDDDLAVACVAGSERADRRFPSVHALSPDGSRLAVGSQDGLQVVATATGAVLGTISMPPRSYPIKFSADGSSLVSLDADGVDARLFDTNTRQSGDRLVGHDDRIWDVHFSPDGILVATASGDHSVRLWKTEDASERARLVGHTRAVYQCEFAPDGKYLVSSSGDGTARVWRVEDGAELATLKHEGVSKAHFSRDGALVVTTGESSARIWNLQRDFELLSELVHDAEVNDASFGPDGKRIATCTKFQSHIWATKTGRRLCSLDSVSGAMRIQFSPGGRILLTSNGSEVMASDVSRSEALVADITEIIAAVLTNGRGKRTATERENILMKTVSEEDEDLGGALARRLEAERPGALMRIAQLQATLSRPLHANCYSGFAGLRPAPQPTHVGDVQSAPAHISLQRGDGAVSAVAATPQAQKRNGRRVAMVLLGAAVLLVGFLAWLFPIRVPFFP